MNTEDQVELREDQYQEDGFVVNDPTEAKRKRQKHEDPSIEVSANNIISTKRIRKPVERYEPSDDEMLDDFTDENEGDVDEGDLDEGDLDEGDNQKDTDASYTDESTDNEEVKEELEEEEVDEEEEEEEED